MVARLVSRELGGGAFGDAVAGVVRDVVTGLLADDAFTGGLATIVGSVLTDFFGQPGIPAALGELADDVVVALLGGSDALAALEAALPGLLGDNDFRNGVVTTVTTSWMRCSPTPVSSTASTRTRRVDHGSGRRAGGARTGRRGDQGQRGDRTRGEPRGRRHRRGCRSDGGRTARQPVLHRAVGRRTRR